LWHSRPGCVPPKAEIIASITSTCLSNTAEGDAEGDCATKEMAVAYWAKALSVETEKVVQQNRDKLMQEELERYMKHAIGARPAGRVYATGRSHLPS